MASDLVINVKFKSLSPLPSSAPTWLLSRSLAPSQWRDRESTLSLVPRNKEGWVGGGGEEGGEAEENGEDDKV